MSDLPAADVRVVKTALRAATVMIVLVAIYCLAPVDVRPHESIFVRLGVALLAFTAITCWEVRAIVKHDYPMLRAIEAVAVVLPWFLFMFAWIYLNYSLASPGSFNTTLTRTSAFYFTMTVFSSVGFGDIVAKSDYAQLLVTFQMIADLIFIAVGLKLLFGAAKWGLKRKERQGPPVVDGRLGSKKPPT